MAVDRRQMLRGGVAAAVLATTSVATVAVAEGDELGRLIEAHLAARVEVARRLDVYNEFDNREYEPGQLDHVKYAAEEQRLDAWVEEAREVEYNAWYDLLEYRPRAMAEAHRRSDHLLANNSRFKRGDDAFEDFIRSFATLPAGVA